MSKLSLSKEPWYKEGLSFNCTGCGQCCTGGPGYVFLSLDEMKSIAAYLKLSLDEFTKKYVRQVLGGRYSLVEDSKTYDCAFLKGKKCQIYPVRPTQCGTYPFWPKILSSRKSWEEAAEFCEGINHKDDVIIPLEKIEAERLLQESVDP